MRAPIVVIAGLGMLSTASGAVHFEKDVWPILKDRCVDCHREPYEENGRKKEPKAELRLDGAGWILHGGKSGLVLKAGQPDQSPLVQLVSLPAEDDDIMPPKGDPLTPDQIKTLRTWIQEGAEFGDWKGNESNLPSEPKHEPIAPTSRDLFYNELAKAVTSAPSEAAIQHLLDVGYFVGLVSTNSPLLQVANVDLGPDLTDVHVRDLEALKEFVTDLDLSRGSITDKSLETLASFSNLTRLNLSRTPVTDAGMNQIKGLKKLRYLNLYATPVTDKGLEPLMALKDLEALYLWESKVTPAGVSRLAKALPQTRIHWKGELPKGP